MRILVLSALLVAATQAAPRFEGNTLRPRYDDLEVEPIDAILGEDQDGEDNPTIEESASNKPYSADDVFSDDILFDKAGKTPPKTSGNSPTQKVPRPEAPEPGTPPPDSGTPSPDSGTPSPDSGTPEPPSENVPRPNQRPQNSNEANPSPEAPGQRQPQSPQQFPTGGEQAPTTGDPNTFQWFTESPPAGASGCGYAANPNTGAKQEVCQLCSGGKCSEAIRMNATIGKLLCKRNKGGHYQPSPDTCIRVTSRPRQ